MNTRQLTTNSFASFMVAVATIAISTFSAGSAHAQVYKGDAYGANININALVIGAGAKVVDNADLPSVGSATALTNQLLNANVQASSTGGLAGAFGVVTANTINTSTVGSNSLVNSFSEIQGLSLFPSLGLNVSAINLSLGSLVSGDVIRSTTTASGGTNNSGTTVVTNLKFGANSLNTLLGADASGTATLLSGDTRTYYLNILGQVSTISTGAVASLVINGQSTTDGGQTRTTEAIKVNVIQGNALAAGTVVVGSSTAGVVVPESGTLTYAGAAGLLLAGPVVVRFRRSAKKK